jgi:MoxR-like ATPase
VSASSARPTQTDSSRTRGGFSSPNHVGESLLAHDYVADRGLSTAAFIALQLGMPLLLEGEPGVGKTEISRTIAAATDRRLIRLQCYEGIDSAAALYEWDYARQLLHMRGTSDPDADNDIFSERFLLSRPLLDALRTGAGAVLLIDEVDRADEAFEAFLLEFLSDFQITIPELGTVQAAEPPVVILTSNRTRDLHDALRRRCIYHWIDYPSPQREIEILKLRAPGLPDDLVRQTALAASALRTLDLFKAPGVSETIAWARALAALGFTRLDVDGATDTLGAIIKDRDDLIRLSTRIEEIVSAAGRE